MKALLTLFFLLFIPSFALSEDTYTTTNNFTNTAPWETCPVQPLPWFTDAEAWAWNEVCMDRIAYMQSVPTNDLRTFCHIEPEAASPHGSTLSARFIAVVSTQEPFVSHVPGNYSGYYCAEISEHLSIYPYVQNQLDLDGSILNEGATFGGDFERGLNLDRIRSFGNIELSGSNFRYLTLRNAIVQGKVSAQRITVEQNAIFESITIIPEKDDQELYDVLASFDEVASYRLASRDDTENENDGLQLPAAFVSQTYRGSQRTALDLQDSIIGGNLALKDSLIMGRAGLLRAEINQGLYAQGTAIGSLVFNQASIGHDLVIWDAIVNEIEGQSADIGGDLSGARAIVKQLDLLDSDISGNLFLSNAVIDRLQFQRGSVGRSVHLRGQGLNLEGEPLAGRFNFVDLSLSSIASALEFQGSYFTTVNLSQSRIGSLRLNEGDRFPIWRTDLEDNPTFSLSGASVGTLFARFPESFIHSIWTINDAAGARGAECGYYDLYEYLEPREISSISEDSSSPIVVYEAEISVKRCQPTQPYWRYGDYPFSVEIFRQAGSIPNQLDDRDLYIALNLDRFTYDEIDENLLNLETLSLYGGRYNVTRLLDWVGESLQIEFRRVETDNDTTDDPAKPVVIEETIGTETIFNPFAYQFLADHLRERGFAHGANRVEFRMHLERMFANWRSQDWSVAIVLILLLDGLWLLFLGFGVYPWFAAVWFMLLVAVGTWRARFAASGKDGPSNLGAAAAAAITYPNHDPSIERTTQPLPTPLIEADAVHESEGEIEIRTERSNLELPATARPTFAACFWYSLENAVPLINPSEDHRSWFHSSPSFFHFQKVSGFLLISIMVASISFS